MNKKKIIVIVVILLVVTNISTAVITGLSVKLIIGLSMNSRGVSFSEVQKYNRVKSLLKGEFIGNTDDNTLMEGSIRGLAEALDDPYTQYMDKKEYDSLEIHTKGSYAGIGVVVGIDPKDNLIMVSEVIENSPAEKSKILAGDKIVKVNDQEFTGDDFEKAVSAIKGQEGTNVKVTVIRKGVNQPLDFNVTRQEIEIKTVKGKELSNGVGYIRILQFGENTSNEFDVVFKDLQSKGVKELVIDLRDNPGGLLDSVVDVGGQILGKRLIVYTVNKQGEKKNYYSQGKGVDMPIVVLVNERSASASEIFAGAIKDYKRAKLVGTKTYGKGVVQSVIPLGDGSALKLTTSKYYTPNGISINKIGIIPDVSIELSDKDTAISKLTLEQDTQLQKAIEVLGK